MTEKTPNTPAETAELSRHAYRAVLPALDRFSRNLNGLDTTQGLQVLLGAVGSLLGAEVGPHAASAILHSLANNLAPAINAKELN